MCELLTYLLLAGGLFRRKGEKSCGAQTSTCLVLVIEGSEFALKSCVHLKWISLRFFVSFTTCFSKNEGISMQQLYHLVPLGHETKEDSFRNPPLGSNNIECTLESNFRNLNYKDKL